MISNKRWIELCIANYPFGRQYEKQTLFSEWREYPSASFRLCMSWLPNPQSRENNWDSKNGQARNFKFYNSKKSWQACKQRSTAFSPMHTTSCMDHEIFVNWEIHVCMSVKEKTSPKNIMCLNHIHDDSSIHFHHHLIVINVVLFKKYLCLKNLYSEHLYSESFCCHCCYHHYCCHCQMESWAKSKAKS